MMFRNTSNNSLLFLTGLKAGWDFNDNGADIMGVYYGVPTNITYAAGKVGNAAVFNGNSLFKIPSINTTTTFTLNLWLNLSVQTGTYDCLMSTASGTAGFYRKNQKISFYYVNADHLSDTNLVNGDWNMITITANAGANVSIYLNGILDSSIFSGYLSNFSFDRIGGNTPSENLNGSIDQMFLWNRVLSEAEITQLYNSGSGVTINGTKVFKNNNNIYKI